MRRVFVIDVDEPYEDWLHAEGVRQCIDMGIVPPPPYVEVAEISDQIGPGILDNCLARTRQKTRNFDKSKVCP